MITPPFEFSLIVTAAADVLTVEVAGELDHQTSDALVRTVVGHLSPGGAAFRRVRLDFGRLTWIDSMGLSALLAVHRHAGAVGVTLHLDSRPGFLERLLTLTGTLDHLTTTVTTTAAAGDPVPEAEAG
ncbi:STAS domain-containing protein [Streptomyces poonensis]|uniref:STAS domain-containing protein n=1 Tax=Streptomyces poonensis TaxID=68255 RepID=A0A918PCW3_9ACTN|nr:STAS domain-containing protein [Streptomyces poonensis]GGY99604.1 hypothetical protein GCM10010365_17890 [Streptomyces poonensis]GLJ92223.1 hypothetical protein GCM10017589_48320 [Streptomyces poonensis]